MKPLRRALAATVNNSTNDYEATLLFKLFGPLYAMGQSTSNSFMVMQMHGRHSSPPPRAWSTQLKIASDVLCMLLQIAKIWPLPLAQGAQLAKNMKNSLLALKFLFFIFSVECLQENNETV